MDEKEKQFSFSRAALSTCGRTKSKFLSLIPVVGLLAAISVCAADAPAPAHQAAERKPAVWMIPPPWPDGRCLRELFDQPDGWQDTRSKITGIGYWATHLDEFFSDEDLRAWFADIREWKLKLGLEVRVIKQDVPVGMDYFRRLSKQMDRFKSLGADVCSIGMDEPCYCGKHVLSKPDDYAVQQTADFIEAFRKRFPGVRVGDLEPYPALPLADLKSWITSLEAELAKRGVRGLEFFRADVDWGAMNIFLAGSWNEMKSLEGFCHSKGMDFSMIYWAADYPRLVDRGMVNEMTWYSGIMYQGGAYATAGGSPDEYVIESWIQVPKRTTPETSPATFTGSVRDFVSTFVHPPSATK